VIVYLVPVGDRRYQLYVEIAVDAEVAGESETERRGFIGRQVQRFRTMLAEAEQARLKRERGEPDGTSGLWQAIMRRVAEAVAEQRLLWHLRHETTVTVQHPDDIEAAVALAEVRAEFTRDVARHLRWTIIDAVAVAITGPLLFLLPGPNVVSWYFTFRTIGHFMSWRGARKGLTAITWGAEASAPLTAVRAALALPGGDRRHRLREIGDQLGLSHLAGFVERMFQHKR
jgi:hypothetical protein